MKLVASALMAGLVVYGAKALPAFIDKRSTWGVMLFILLAFAFIVVCFVAILRSRTRIDATHIEQSWITNKRVAIADITQVKLIYIPGLAWLIAPRLIVKTRRPGSTVFHTADPMVLAAFARLSLGQAPLPS
ncbi:hypothetical protein DZC73_07600 [Albitalea terrae]|uniref:Uncharacterized protein n=1 Tax=Piscinibacter terrae TaxID=2496871 RepID=A0A3N7HR70_9BURK|nr:hypothetical protein DZC73_07600 [Albitalea terrae]